MPSKKVDGDIILSAGLDTTNVSKRIQSLQKSISRGFKNFLRIGLGVRSIFTLIRKLRGAVIEGFQNLAQVHQPFNEAVSQVITSLNLLKNTAAAAFAPLVEIVAPILSKFINLMANAISQIGQFIAALTGKEYVQAMAVQLDYAESVNKTTNSAKDATKAAKDQNRATKELKRTLAGFDDVEILHEDKDTDTTTDSELATPNYAFSNMPIGDAVNQFAKDFMAAWASMDFTDIGRTIALKLQNALDSINWDAIKQRLKNIADMVATFLNGFFSVPGLFYSIGKTLAQALNSAFEFVGEFAKKFKWDFIGSVLQSGILGVVNNIDWNMIYTTIKYLGDNIGRFLISALTNIPWDEVKETIKRGASAVALFINSLLLMPGLFTSIGVTIAQLINTIAEGINIFVTNIHWANIGAKLGEGLTTALNTIDINLIGDTLVHTINGAIDFLIDFASNVELDNFATNLALNITKVLTKIKWGQFGLVLALCINKLILALNTIITTIDFAEIANTVATSIADCLSTVEWANLGIFIANLSVALVKLIFNRNWIGAASALVSGLSKAFGGFVGRLFQLLDEPFTELYNWFKDKTGPEIIQGLWEGIKSALVHVGTWIRDNVFIPFCEGILTAFGIHSPATSMIGYGVQIIHGLWEGIKSVIANVKSFIKEHILDKFMNAITRLFGLDGNESILVSVGKDLMNGFLTGIKEVGNTVFTWFDENIATPIIEKFNDVKSTITSLFTENDFGATAMLNATPTIDDYTDSLQRLGNVANEVGDPNYGWITLDSVIRKLRDSGDLSTEAFKGLSDQISVYLGTGTPISMMTDQIAATLEKAGVNADTFSEALTKVSPAMDNTTESIKNLGSEASTTDTNTQAVGTALGKFKDLSWVTPVKVAIISKAVEALGKKGDLSKDDVINLQKTLDDYDPKEPITSMNKIEKALESVGLATDDFTKLLVKNTKNGTNDVTTQLNTLTTNLKNTGLQLKIEGETSGKNIGDGLVIGLKDKEASVNAEATKLIQQNILGAIDTAADSHSPSKEAKKRGKYIVEGLQEGMQSISLESTAKNIINNLIGVFDQGFRNVKTQLARQMKSLGTDMFNSFSNIPWFELGYNITTGIYNGIAYRWNWLINTSRNLAINMLNAAKWALGVASPSKEFFYIGEMVTKGLGEGIVDSKQFAVNAVDSVTDSIIDAAEDAQPTIEVDAKFGNWIDKLDTSLNSFIDKFGTLTNILSMSNNNVASYKIPAVAEGRVVPSTTEVLKNTATDVQMLRNHIESLASSIITRDELTDILVSTFQQYMNISLYLGDEQVARHANAGNLKLQRRYSIIN